MKVLGTAKRTLTNIILLLLAPAPSVLYCVYCSIGCDETSARASELCRLCYFHPLALLNALFFVNVCGAFWILGLLQRSTWLIDPFWTFIPVLIAHFYSWACPNAQAETARQLVALGLIWLWAVRLTHSYFRRAWLLVALLQPFWPLFHIREKWEVGAREDWRYADMRARWGGAWPLVSFFAVYLIQQGMLVGLTLPLYTVFSSRKGWQHGLDSPAVVGCITGILMAARADNQLYHFMQGNERRIAAGKKPELLLNTGLWRFSRHPNYFFEQLFWWSLALFGAAAGHPWVFLGPFFNTLCMVQVTRLTEERMLRRSERAGLYKSYMQRTSIWLPMPPKRE